MESADYEGGVCNLPSEDALKHRGVKRKAPNGQSPEQHPDVLATIIAAGLSARVQDDSIQECGPACLAILKSRPNEVLGLAHQNLHTWPYKHVPTCWRRMYEEASLWLTVELLRDQAEDCEIRTEHGADAEVPWLSRVVNTLDMAIQLTGTPGRAKLFETIFDELKHCVISTPGASMPSQFSIVMPGKLQTQQPIPRHSSPLEFEEFQAHLDDSNTPFIMTGAIEHWPARVGWTSPSYWMKRTLGGRRLVPVEVGSQYTDDAWSQKIIPFRDFLSTYMLGECTEPGYLAQYDLFAQIPALRSDIQVPDYCYCSPPRPTNGTTTHEVDEPLMNLWLGPAGTKTPLHTDPYSNILAQVMGYKYVRLYSPKETIKLYPLGTNDKGVDMSNTSSIDVSLDRVQCSDNADERLKATKQSEKYQSFNDAKFVEGILGPGESLYIPQGWWHYVEGLTIGASVSFWWN